ESVGQLGQRVEPDVRGDRILKMSPGAAPDVHGHEPGRPRRADVVVDAVTDVRDFLGGAPGQLNEPGEEVRARLADAQARGRGDRVHLDGLAPEPLLELAALISGDAHEVAPAAEL